MMLGEILVRFGAETSGLMRGIEIAKSGLIGIGIAAAVAGVAIVSVLGGLSVKAAADFQQGLSRLVTGAGDVTDNMQKMGQSILGVSVATGVMTGPLLQAMYQIISANQRGAEAENTLAVAAKGSVAEQANVVDVAKAVSGAMTDYGTKQYNATQFMNGLTRATQLGKLTLEQLSLSMGPLMPLAANLGIKYSDLAGAMSTMTNASIPPERAATSLRFAMQSLENPTTKAKDAMKAMGLDSVAVGNELKVSLPGALQMIYDAAKKAGPEGSVPFNRAVSDMIGGQRSLQAFMALTGSHFKTFVTDTQQVADAMNASKTAVLGWDTAQKNFNVQIDRGKAVIAALAINVGTALLPVLTQIVQKIIPLVAAFADWVIKSHAVENAIKFVQNALSAIAPYAQAFGQAFLAVMPMLVQLWNAFADVVQRTSKWLAENKGFMEALKFVVIALGAVLGGILLTMLVIVVAGLTTLGLAIIIIVGIVNGAIQVVHAFGDVWNRTGAAIQVAIAWIVAAFHTLVNAAVTAFNAVKQAIVTAFQATIAWIVGAWQNAIAFIVGIWNTLKGAAVAAWNAITTAIQTAVNGVVNWLKSIWNACVQAVVAAFQWLYAHNYYFQALCDTIRNVVQAVISWLQQAWSNVVTYLQGRWEEIASSASALWANITNAISTAITFCQNLIQTVWSAITSYLQARWQAIASSASALWANITSAISTAVNFCRTIIQTVWSAIVSFLAGIWATIIGAVHGAWAAITGAISGGVSNAESPITAFGGWLSSTFGGFASAAVSWGASVIQGLVNGILGALGGLRDAVGQAGQIIANILGFHSPTKEGPGRDLDIWGPALAHGFAQGITKGIPEVQAAVTLMMRPVESTMTTGVSTSGAAQAAQGGGTSRMIALLESIDKKLDQGQPISRYQLTQALGLLLAEGVRR
jgi:TP901 family phage tail tape measure protein